MANRSSRKPLSEAERAERRQRDRERLHQTAEQLLSSEGWQRWVRVRSQAGLARLSVSNQLLVALARPEATFVAGFKAWLQMGFAVRKGERAIAIIAPLPIKDRDRVTGEETGETRMLFKTVFVFDRAQVDPIEGRAQTPLAPPSQPLTGDSHAHLLAPTRAFAESLGFTVALESIPGQTGGWCDSTRRRIVVDADQPANAQLRILVHEAVHALGVGYAEYGRERAEVIVDTVTYVVLAGQVGLDVGGESIPYVAGWGESGELDAIREYAETIDKIARRIEDALGVAAAAVVPIDQPRELECAA
jgi:N-terminal domain of anti-restriction factor ArdC